MKHRLKPLGEDEKDLHSSENSSCECGQDCDCEPKCDCNDENSCCCENDNHESKHCDCGCEDEETKSEHCKHHTEHDHGKCCGHSSSKEEEYLNMARVIQADFDNFRKKSYEQILQARREGEIQAIETFLPALDAFSEAKKMITDEKILQGIEMVEKKILEALEILGVEKIEAVGKPFDHNLHNAIATCNDDSLDDDVVQAEYQAGYKFKDKVIRYSQVIVNKKEGK